MDLRIERTRRSIINAFIELRSQKPIEKITIKELAEHACINKATFYSHYEDIYDLAEQLETETISSIVKGIAHLDMLVSNPKLVVTELCVALHAHESLLYILFSGSRAGLMVNRLESILKEEVYNLYPEHRNNLKLDIILSVLIHGNFQAFLSHSEYKTDDVTEILGEIGECLVNNYLEQL